MVRYFVPVQKDLVIGNFTVPSNGMFDIVQQQFYANAGTGSFEIKFDGDILEGALNNIPD